MQAGSNQSGSNPTPRLSGMCLQNEFFGEVRTAQCHFRADVFLEFLKAALYVLGFGALTRL